MHTSDINLEEQLNRLLAEMSENRRQLQNEISARQKAEMALREFVASRNAKILQATEDALRSAWEELEEKRRLVKEQQSRIQFLEARLAEAAEATGQVADAPATIKADELAPVETDELAPVKAEEPVQMVLELEEPHEVLIFQAEEDESACPPEESQPWFLNKRLHQWLSPGQLSLLSPGELSPVGRDELPSASASETGSVQGMLPAYQWHPRRPAQVEAEAEAEADSERVEFLGQSQTKSSLKRFIEEERMACADILDDVDEERHTQAEQKVRQLRLAARELGAQELEARAGDVETCLNQGEERIFVVRRVVEMESAMKSLLEDIALVIEPGGAGMDSEPAAVKPGESALELVRRMGELLSAGSEEVRSYLDEYPSVLDDLLEPEEAEDFVQYVQNGEYDQALQMIEYYL